MGDLGVSSWDQYWSRPYVRYEGHQQWFWKEVLSHVKGKILDIGCGAASMWRGKDFDVTGFDYSPQAIAEAKKNYPQGRFFVGDLKTMPPQGPYDCVVCVGVLHYFLPDLSPLKTLLTGSTTNLLIITLNSDVDLGIFKDWGKIISARFENRKGWVIVFRL